MSPLLWTRPSSTRLCAFSTTSARAKGPDRYSKAQKRAHDAALRSKQRKSEEEEQSAGDPVRGIPTDFVRKFSDPQTDFTNTLNFRVPPPTLERQLKGSRKLLSGPSDALNAPIEPKATAYEAKWEDSEAKEAEGMLVQSNGTEDAKDRTAREAVKRIVGMNFANSKQRLRRNVDLCIETFGRHNTDETILADKTKAKFRAGKDSGSSEVQIAILTAKINNLAENLHHKDKNNKRHLQEFVHKRQKLLRYLRRKENGGPRWQNLVQTLGLTDATWKGQINI